MSIFSKPASSIGPLDLRELVTEGAVENLRLEFKREVPKKDETLKKLSSFANTLGGLIVVGAEAGGDGRISALAGVDVEPSYKQTLVQWCFEGLAPPLEVDVSDPIPIAGSRVCYVIQIAESDLGPHFINGRRGVYVRSNEFSARFEAQLANETELRHLFQRRQVVRERRQELLERARQRFETFTAQRYAELKMGTREAIGGRFHLCIAPRFPAQPVTSHAGLLEIVDRTRISWRQVGFPRTTVGTISQHESVVVLRPGSSFSILEANVWGMLFYATEIEDTRDEYDGIHLYHFLGQLLVFLEHAGLMLTAMGYSGPLKIDMQLESLRGARWIYAQDNFPMKGPASELDNDVSFSLTTNSDELIKRRDALVMDLARYVFFATNWADVATNATELERMVKTGYGYNFWGTPATLRV